jgi:lysophospholipase L1-like esterase
MTCVLLASALAACTGTMIDGGTDEPSGGRGGAAGEGIAGRGGAMAGEGGAAAGAGGAGGAAAGAAGGSSGGGTAGTSGATAGTGGFAAGAGGATAGTAGAGGAAAGAGGAAPFVMTRILPLGDSITQGRRGSGIDLDPSCNGPVLTYRYPLWKKLVDAGASFKFVGSMTGGFNGDPNWADYAGRSFDRAHEGHWGWKLTDVLPKLPGWLAGYEAPDVAIVMLGTNDGGAPTVDDMVATAGKIIDALRARNPRIVVIWGHTYQEWAPFPEYRMKLDALAKQKSTADSPILTVDTSKGWISKPQIDCNDHTTKTPNSCTVDWVHPNDRGGQQLADLYYPVLLPYLRKR